MVSTVPVEQTLSRLNDQAKTLVEEESHDGRGFGISGTFENWPGSPYKAKDQPIELRWCANSAPCGPTMKLQTGAPKA